MNTNSSNDKAKDHEVSLRARQELEVSGVEDVMSFDEAAVELNTVCGVMRNSFCSRLRKSRT